MDSQHKTFVNWQQTELMVHDIVRQITLSGWRPDYVVGLTRGGLVPANLLSQYFDVPMHTLKVSLRDNPDVETNCWMAEDAFGCESHDPMIQGSEPKNILIVDDINDSGATLNWIRSDWQSSCLPQDDRWNEVWGHNVRVAVMVDNVSSKFVGQVDYCAREINKAERDEWIVFPWEEWWRN